jgi:hypothetical protein
MCLRRIVFCGIFYACCYASDGAEAQTKKVPLSRERARYEFIEEHLAPSILEKSFFDKSVRKITLSAVTIVITFVLVRLILTGITYVPPLKQFFDYLKRMHQVAMACQKARNFFSRDITGYLKERAARIDFFKRSDMEEPSLQPWRVPKDEEWPDTEPLIKTITDKRDELVRKIDSFWFSLFTILCPLVYKVVVYCADTYGATYMPLLMNYIQHWNEYRIGTPDKFRDDFDLLQALFVMRGNKLEIGEDVAQFMVTSMVMQCIDARCDEE